MRGSRSLLEDIVTSFRKKFRNVLFGAAVLGGVSGCPSVPIDENCNQREHIICKEGEKIYLDCNFRQTEVIEVCDSGMCFQERCFREGDCFNDSDCKSGETCGSRYQCVMIEDIPHENSANDSTFAEALPCRSSLNCGEGEFCNSSGDCTAKQNQPIIFSDESIHLMPDDLQEVRDHSLVIDSDIYVEQGSILRGSLNGLPFLRKVSDTTRGSGFQIVQTESALLTEGFERLDVASTGKANFSSQNRRSNLYDFTLFEDQLGSVHGSLSFTFDPDIETHILIGNSRLETFLSAVSGSLDVMLTLEAETNRGFSVEQAKRLGSFHGVPIIAGPLFIQPVLDVSIDAFARLDSEGHAMFRSSQTLEMYASALYRNNLWDFESRASAEIHTTTVDFQIPSRAHVEGGIRAEAKLLVYGLVGPTLSLRPYLSLDGQLNHSEISAVDWKLNLGMDGTYGGEIGILGHNLIDREYGLPFNLHRELLSGTFVFGDLCEPAFIEQCRGNDVWSVDSCTGSWISPSQFCEDGCQNIDQSDAECLDCIPSNPEFSTTCLGNNVFSLDNCGNTAFMVQNCPVSGMNCVQNSLTSAVCAPVTSDTHGCPEQCSVLEDSLDGICVPVNGGHDGNSFFQAIPLQFNDDCVAVVNGVVENGEMVDYFQFNVDDGISRVSVYSTANEGASTLGRILYTPPIGNDYVSQGVLLGSEATFTRENPRQFDSGKQHIAVEKYAGTAGDIYYTLTITLD